jgi:hypothetical protein
MNDAGRADSAFFRRTNEPDLEVIDVCFGKAVEFRRQLGPV